MLLEITTASLLSIIFFFSDFILIRIKKYKKEVTSYSTGLFISYIFLSMFPELFNGINHIDITILYIALSGFIIFHVIEKQILYKTKDKIHKLKQLYLIDQIAFSIEHFTIGFALIFFFKVSNPVFAILIFFPLMFHIISSSLILEHLHKKIHETPIKKVLHSSIILIGAIVSIFFQVSIVSYYAIFSFVTGILLYIIIKNALPQDRTTKPIFFLSGIMSYIFLLSLQYLITI